MRRLLRTIGMAGLAMLLTAVAASAQAPAFVYNTIPPDAPDIQHTAMVAGDAVIALQQSDFAALESMSARYRSTQSRTPAGEWDLAYFYQAFDVDRSGDFPREIQAAAALQAKAEHWAAAYPASPAARIAVARLMIVQGELCACEAQHGNRQRDWRQAQGHFEDARRYLMAHRDVAGGDPGWYAAMLQVALGEGWTRAAYLPVLEEGLSRFPDYYDLYDEAAFLDTPYRGGSVDDLDGLVRRAVAATKDEEGTGAYARIYGRLGRRTYGNGLGLFVGTRATWDRLAAAYGDLVAAHPDPRLYSEFFFYACLAGDRPRAAQAAAQAGEASTFYRIWPVAADFERCRAWAAGTDASPSPLQQVPLPAGIIPADPAAAPRPALLETFARWLLAVLEFLF